MTVRKLVGLVVVVTALFTGLDLVRWGVAYAGVLPTLVPYGTELAALSRGLQLVRTFLVPAVLFAAAPAAMADPRDRRRMILLFAAMVFADILILGLGHLVPGVLVFLVVQVVLTLRHAEGARDAARCHPEGLTRVIGLTLGCVALWSAVVFGLAEPLDAAGLRGVVAVYAAVLGASLISAWSRVFLENGDPGRARRIALGMTAFTLCDMTVAAGAVFAGSPIGQGADLLTGICYGPALVLLATSVPARPAA